MAFKQPAWLALVSELLPKERLARASGMITFSWAAPNVAAPALGGVLIELIGLGGVVMFDLVTATLALITLLLASQRNMNSHRPSKEIEHNGGFLEALHFVRKVRESRHVAFASPVALAQPCSIKKL